MSDKLTILLNQKHEPKKKEGKNRLNYEQPTRITQRQWSESELWRVYTINETKQQQNDFEKKIKMENKKELQCAQRKSCDSASKSIRRIF